MDIKVPGLHSPAGLGDVIKKATTKLGVKPCGGCQKRAESLNRMLRFSPTGPTVGAAPLPGPRSLAGSTVKGSSWTQPPEVPEGWFRMDKRGEWDGPIMFRHQDGRYLVWTIREGKYTRAHTFCAGSGHLASAEFLKRCR